MAGDPREFPRRGGHLEIVLKVSDQLAMSISMNKQQLIEAVKAQGWVLFIDQEWSDDELREIYAMGALADRMKQDSEDR